MGYLRFVGCVAVSVSMLAACGGGGKGGGSNAGGGGSNGSGPIDSAGGTVSLPSGPSVVFPAGAVSASTMITVERTSQTSPGGAPVWQFGPAGTSFATPVAVTMPLPAGLSGPLSVYWTRPGSTTQYDALPAAAVSGGVQASVTHFSLGFAGPACVQDGPCTAPGNPCQVGSLDCSSGAPVCAMLRLLPEGAACGDARVCSAGACVAACVPGSACTPATPDPCKLHGKHCNQVLTGYTCDPAADAAEGTACGAGRVCSTGTCVTACLPGQSCQPTAADPCHTHQTGCNATLTVTTCDPLLPLQNGTSCGTDQVCNGGSCVACAAGGPCGSSNECHTGAFSCSTGSQVCTDTGNKADGTTCAGGVCGGGSCNACTPGAACASANPCRTATEVCTSGFRVCTDGGNQPPGTACGSGLVCDVGGACIAACVPGQPCAGADPCKTHQTACAADLSQPASCVASGDRADGTTCGAGLVCAGGACSCNAVALGAAPAVTPVLVAQAAPAPAGGTVLEGTYHVTAMTAYTGPGGASGPAPEQHSYVFLLSGGPYQVLEVRNGTTFRSSGTYAVFGNRLVHRATCGSTGVADQGFTASGAELRVYDASKPNETLEMLLVRQGPTCIDGQACTVASPEACKVYGMTCDAAHLSGTCGALANAPVGTPCGVSSACDAAGACVASSTRTVSGTWRTTYWLDSGARLDVDELVGAGDSIAAIVGSGASATRIAGQLLPNGTFAIPGVPFGPYVLEVILAGFVPLYVDEIDSALDLGVDWMGRPDAALATLSTNVIFSVAGLTPWASGDGLVVTAPNGSHGSAGSLGPILATFAPGATQGSFGYDSRAVGRSLGWALIDTTAGDQAWVHQLVASGLSTPNGNATVLAAGPWAQVPSMTVQDGLSTSVGTPQAPLVLQAPPATGSAAVDFRGAQFAAHAPDVNPLARRTHQARVNVLASARGLTRPLPVNYNDYLPLRIPLLNLELTGTPLLNLDTDLGTLSYGTGFFPGFPEWRLAARNVNVTYVAPGATTGWTVGSGLGRADPMPAPSPIVPVLTPPRSPLVNGQDARTFQGDITLTPTLSWSPPAVGSPTAHVVQVMRIAAAGTATTATTVASYRTAASSLTLPPGVLQDDSTYVFHIQAFQTGATPAADLLAQPRRRGMSTAWGFALTGLLRTCSTGNCPACADGAACGAPGACQVAALSCANGFLCAVAPAPDETSCGPGAVCSGGQCVGDLEGTWVGTYSRSGVSNGVAYADSTHTMARSLVQTGSTILNRGVSTSGARGRQTCTRAGASITCSGHGASGDCAFAVSSTATVQATTPPQLAYSYTATLAGGSCVGRETGSGTLVKQLSGTAGSSIAGAYTYAGTFADFAGATEVGSGSVTGQVVATQVGNGFVTDSLSSAGATTTCIGFVDGSTTTRVCAGANGACSFGGTAWSSGGPLSYEYLFGRGCAPGVTRQTGLLTATRTCAGSSCPRTVTGRFATSFWPDAGSPTVLPAPRPPGTAISALYLNTGGSYGASAGSLAADGSFSIPGVPQGSYFLRVAEPGLPPRLYQLTTSTPDLTATSSARPDSTRPTAATPVTLDWTGLDPWGTSVDALFVMSTQANLEARLAWQPASTPEQPSGGATTFSGAVSDWGLLTDIGSPGLPDAAKGDVVYFHQRHRTLLTDAGGAPIGRLDRSARFARVTDFTLVDGVPYAGSVSLQAAPLDESVDVDLRVTQFAQLGAQVNAAATAAYGIGGYAVVHGVPHSNTYPDVGGARIRWFYLQAFAGADRSFGTQSFGGFLAEAHWRRMLVWGSNWLVPFAFPGATATDYNVWHQEQTPLSLPVGPIAPTIWPPSAPLVNGLDAFVERTGVGSEPTFTWGAPGLGAPTSYAVTLYQVGSDGAGGTAIWPVLSASGLGSHQFRVPPGALAAGAFYFAEITAQRGSGWDLPDAPLLQAGPGATASLVTAMFTP